MSPSALAGSPPRLHLPIERFELKCGAKLLVCPRPSAPVTAVQVQIRGGAALDPVGMEGLAFLTARMTDQGTREHNEEELAELLEPTGGHVSGSAGGLSGSIAGDRWKLLLQIMSECLTSPTYPKSKVARQKVRHLDRLLIERDDPRVQVGRCFRKLVYGDHWLSRPSLGTPEGVAAIQNTHLKTHHSKNWVARRAIVAVCGDVEPAAVKRHLDRLLRDWKPGTRRKPDKPSFPKIERRVEVFSAEREQAHVYLGHLGITRKHPDYAALVVMDHILGTGPGFTNRVSRRLRDELGLAYSVHADIHSSAGLLPGTFSAYIGTSPENLATSIEGFLQEIRRIQVEPVDEEELETAKSYLLGTFVLSFERAARRAGYMISSEVFSLPDDELEQLPRKFSEVSVADVQRVAQSHLHPEASCLAVAGPVRRAEVSKLYARALASLRI